MRLPVGHTFAAFTVGDSQAAPLPRAGISLLPKDGVSENGTGIDPAFIGIAILGPNALPSGQ